MADEPTTDDAPQDDEMFARFQAFQEWQAAQGADSDEQVEAEEETAEAEEADDVAELRARLEALEAENAKLKARRKPRARAASTTPDVSKMTDKERYDYWKGTLLPDLTRQGNAPHVDLKAILSR